MERIKDYLLMEEEYIKNQERMKPQDDRNEEERSKVDDLRGSPMAVGSLEEIIDENHAIVSTSVGSEHYVSIFSFVDKVILKRFSPDFFVIQIDNLKRSGLKFVILRTNSNPGVRF